MLELLAQVDPLAALMGGLWLFAAGMFPFGFMLGSNCSACCGCSACTIGQLPETLTVTFAGLADQTPGPDLISLEFAACFGSGAEARVTAPGGDPEADAGPISKVKITEGGSGYAKLGRVAPTLTITGAGSGATFTPTLSSANDACGVPSWSLESVAASGGTGYTDGEWLTITAATGDTEVTLATARLYADRSKPDLTLDGNATATVNMAQVNDGTVLVWVVGSVTVTDGGTGYSEGQTLGFDKAVDDVQDAAALGVANVVHDLPTNPDISIYKADLSGLSSGTGAVLEPVWELLPQSQWAGPHKKTYRLASITVVDGGTGYGALDYIEILFPSDQDGIVVEHAYIDCDYPDANGTIQQVNVADQSDPGTPTPAGIYIGSQTDALHSVAMTNGGSYYKDDPGARVVVVENPGSYYREDASEPPYVADVTVTILQDAPSDGAGAEIIAAVDDDTSSATFGQITGLTIDAGGTGYLAWKWMNTKCCGDYYNGMSVVVRRPSGANKCVFSHSMCGVGNRLGEPGEVAVFYDGPQTPPRVQLRSERRVNSDEGQSSLCNTDFTTESLVVNCSEWTDANGQLVSEFTGPHGETATIALGGDYDATFRNPGGGGACFICCKGESSWPDELSVDYTDNTPSKATLDLSGTYVLTKGSFRMGQFLQHLAGYGYGNGQLFQVGTVGQYPWGAVGLNVQVTPCSDPASQFSPDPGGCDFCHKKCRVTAGASTGVYTAGGVISYGAGVGPFLSGGVFVYVDDSCSMCETTPICEVSGRTFELTDFEGTPRGSIST